MSQAIALQEYLEKAGHAVEKVFVGCDPSGSVPGYFQAVFQEKLERFFHPYFLRLPNRKGIYVGRTLGVNFLRSFLYLREIRRLRAEINGIKPDVVFNFYELVGALALRKVDTSIVRIGIGHHFYHHLTGYPCHKGSAFHRWFFSLLSRGIMRSCDRVLALSFRKESGRGKIEVVPPLIRYAFRQISYQPGERFLVYLLYGGFLYDLIVMARANPDFHADVFTTLEPEMELPPGIQVHPLSDEKFREKMAHCKGLITTAGFDTVAEAAYLGIPLMVIPSRNHFEQQCNRVDAERSGLAKGVDHLEPGMEQQMHIPNNQEYNEWVKRIEELMIKSLEK
jgi:uncharacterized protein (TIGR00661 family)